MWFPLTQGGSASTSTAAPAGTLADTWGYSWVARPVQCFTVRVRGINDAFWAESGSNRTDSTPLLDTIYRDE